MIRMRVAVAAMFVALLAGCAGAQAGFRSQPPARAAATALDSRLIQANERFSLKLFDQLRQESPGKNIFVSPPSVSLALAMTANGANGATREAMLQALQLNGISLDEVNKANADLQSILTNPDPKVKLSIANSIWYRKGLTVAPAFQKAVQAYYSADVEPLDMGRKDAVRPVNQWVDKATNGKIKAILDQAQPEDVMYLINAIYFLGTWTDPFDESLTKPRPFHLPDGTTKSHPLMAKGGHFRYLKGEGFQAVSLPYGSERVSLYVFLPDEASSLEAFCGDLTAERWADWMGRFDYKQGSILLPTVKVEYDVNLVRAMKTLGMGAAFGPQADLSALFSSDQKAFISQIRHKTYLDINERGTEAAAVTAVRAAGSAAPKEPFSMVVDRPFFIAIRDNQTGVVLFLGAITNP